MGDGVDQYNGLFLYCNCIPPQYEKEANVVVYLGSEY